MHNAPDLSSDIEDSVHSVQLADSVLQIFVPVLNTRTLMLPFSFLEYVFVCLCLSECITASLDLD